MFPGLLSLWHRPRFTQFLGQIGRRLCRSARAVEVGDIFPCRDRVDPGPARIGGKRDGCERCIELRLPEACLGDLHVPVIGHQ